MTYGSSKLLPLKSAKVPPSQPDKPVMREGFMFPKAYPKSQPNYGWYSPSNEPSKVNNRFSQGSTFLRISSCDYDGGASIPGKNSSYSAYPFSFHSKARSAISPIITSFQQKKKEARIARQLIKDRKIKTLALTGQTTSSTLRNQMEKKNQDAEITTPYDLGYARTMDLKYFEDAKLKLESICGAQVSEEQLEFLIMEYVVSRCSLTSTLEIKPLQRKRMVMNRCSSASTSSYEDVHFLH